MAIDMGAESCRVSLLRWIEGKPEVRLVRRFPNGAIADSQSQLRWNIAGILDGVEQGLRACAEAASEGIASIGVDGWAVDYVRFGHDGTPVEAPYCYRDQRNLAAEAAAHDRISPERLYELTGIQRLSFNTLYQLFADVLAGKSPDLPWVNLPEHVTYHLGGRRVAEYTNATHTGLVTLGAPTWCSEIFDALGLSLGAAPSLVPPGSCVGTLQGPLSELPALRETRLIVPACHDTASAIAGIPAEGDDWAFLSSGTWSLVGTTLDRACTSAEAREKNYTNLGGVGGKVCFLKNVNGLWLIQQCLEQWALQGKRWRIADLVEASERLPAPERALDVDDPDLLMPGDMIARINRQRVRKGARPLSERSEDAPVIAGLIFHSLAARYAEILADVRRVTGKPLTRLFVVGGGSKNAFLNRLTAEASGLEVVRGAVESSTLGNFAIQLASLQGAYDPNSGVDGEAVSRCVDALLPAFREAELRAPEAVSTQH